MKRLILTAAILIVVVNTGRADTTIAPSADRLDEKTGLKVGETIPSFRLQDQKGKEQTLKSLAADADYVALVFYRSAGW